MKEIQGQKTMLILEKVAWENAPKVFYAAFRKDFYRAIPDAYGAPHDH